MIEQLINQELDIAIEKYGYFHSMHEAESVLREEIEELGDEIEQIRNTHRKIFSFIRSGDKHFILPYLKKLRASTVNAIDEAIQVAAMCDKAILFLEKERKQC